MRCRRASSFEMGGISEPGGVSSKSSDKEGSDGGRASGEFNWRSSGKRGSSWEGCSMRDDCLVDEKGDLGESPVTRRDYACVLPPR